MKNVPIQPNFMRWEFACIVIANITWGANKMARRDLTFNGKHSVRKMNDDTYSLRRDAMKFIYEAKRLVPDLPRITIRITDSKNKNTLGTATAYMNGHYIAITAEATQRRDLKEVVYHEILHAVYGVEHDDDCPLMSPTVGKKSSSKELDRLFLKHAKGSY